MNDIFELWEEEKQRYTELERPIIADVKDILSNICSVFLGLI